MRTGLDTLQDRSVLLVARVASAGTVTRGKNLISVNKSATGTYDVTILRNNGMGTGIPFASPVLPVVTPIGSGDLTATVNTLAEGTFTVLTRSAGSLADAEFLVHIYGTDLASEA